MLQRRLQNVEAVIDSLILQVPRFSENRQLDMEQ